MAWISAAVNDLNGVKCKATHIIKEGFYKIYFCYVKHWSDNWLETALLIGIVPDTAVNKRLDFQVSTTADQQQGAPLNVSTSRSSRCRNKIKSKKWMIIGLLTFIYALEVPSLATFDSATRAVNGCPSRCPRCPFKIIRWLSCRCTTGVHLIHHDIVHRGTIV